uniref:Uncharacterized protein n=1 Tax=uncultured prokaryote TaxID=198431 RepID=A0A0H5QGN9_9ZZZZ|nr:hypothetical protein [uncultured prokaryote]
MANEKHLYLTVGGGYVSTLTQLANETWQFGIRCSLVFGQTDPVGTLPSNWNPVSASINRTETDWNITGNWTVAGPGLDSFAPDDWLNDQAAPAIEAFIATSGLFSTGVQLREAKVYPIGTDGKAVPAPPYAGGSPVTLTWTGTLPIGGASGEIMPPQNTMVLSHRTNQIGRKGRGRIFAPPLTTGAVDDGQISSASRAALSAAHVTLLEDVAYGTYPTQDLEVRPAVIGAPWTTYATINTSVVDSAFDTQRRRRRALITAATTAAVSY